MSGTDHSARGRAPGWLCWLFSAMLLVGAAWAGPAPAPAPAYYRVINLPPGGMTGWSGFNASDQIAISRIDAHGVSRGYLHDGNSVIPIGSLGGTQTLVRGLNDAGEVVGHATLAGDTVVHAFRWSRREGMRDLGTLDGAGMSESGFLQPINKQGDVVGYSSSQAGTEHAFLWRRRGGLLDLGGLPDNPGSFSVAHAINDAGMVGGQGLAANGETHAFVWTRTAGMRDLGTLGGNQSGVIGISDDGVVLGNSLNANGHNEVFVWTRAGGMVGLGTAGGLSTNATRYPSRNGNLAGDIRYADDSAHAFLWTRRHGLRDLGTLPNGRMSIGFAVNDKAQVVGTATTPDELSAGFIWTARDGMIDLNTRLRHAPGLQVGVGLVISESGLILANTSAGTVFLKPDCRCPRLHTVGAIAAADTVRVGAPFDAGVAFAGDDPAAQYHVTWSWGDGSGEQQGNARVRDGAGSASASHRFSAPGVYTVQVRVGERLGQAATVSRRVEVRR